MRASARFGFCGADLRQLVLADEINRTPPKTQAALLQAMQERSVSVAGRAMIWVSHSTCLRPRTPLSRVRTPCQRHRSIASDAAARGLPQRRG